MKILVLSDSHGNYGNMVRAVEQEQPRMVFHLGDGWRDAQRLADQFHQIPLEQVPGNCDFLRKEPAERLVVIKGKRFLLCHGHTMGVKYSLSQAAEKARELDLDMFLFGHTHTPLVDRQGKAWFFNPGSIGEFRPSYGVVMIDEAGGGLDARTVLLNG